MATGENGQQPDGTGRLLAGRYRVAGRLGRGGMGIVWRAFDEVLGREVAVKELRTYNDTGAPELADLRVRMQREARAAARVRHRGVIAVHDVAEVDGRPLIVMELVDGPSLDDVLRDRGPREAREAAAIGAEVMDALAAAHRAGVLHRDVKPGNILLERTGRVILTDFGIAAMDDPADGSATRLTRSGELVGSLDYLAPERAQGQQPGPASDIWALGATLYAAVEGNSPFRRTSTWSTLTAIVVDPLPPPRRAGALGGVLQLLMAKQPEERPSAQEAADLLREVAEAPLTRPGIGSLAKAPPPPERGATTEANTPLAQPGFGPPQDPYHRPAQPPLPQQPMGPAPFQQPAAAPPPGAPAAPPPGTGHGPGAATGTRPGAAPRRRGRTLLAAGAVVVVLAATGVAVAVLDNGPDKPRDTARKGPRPAVSAGTPAPGSSSGTLQDPGAVKSPRDKKDPSPEGGKDKQSHTPDGAPSDKPSERPGGGPAKPTRGAGPSGTGGSGDKPPPAPACQSIGGGKYNCSVWRAATSVTAAGAQAGTLNAGTNYFFCQQNLGRRETYGKWTNVWWAKTDDDSGNTNVFVSDVYLQGGDNNEPVPGLPVC